VTASIQKYTTEQVETMEVAPGFEHHKLEGWIPAFATEQEVRSALEQAFDYRGDVTLTLKDGTTIEGYIFNRLTGATLADSYVEYYTADVPAKQSTRYSEIARLEFTGKDRAAGKQWEDWIRKYNERKAAGEKNIALNPEALD
jgi:hypothetical protein